MSVFLLELSTRKGLLGLNGKVARQKHCCHRLALSDTCNNLLIARSATCDVVQAQKGKTLGPVVVSSPDVDQLVEVPEGTPISVLLQKAR